MNTIILAGGKSSRMGKDKAFLKIGRLSLIKRQITLLKNIFKDIIIVTNRPHKYKIKGVKIVKDIIKGCGPLSGIHAGLKASDSAYNFVVGCDMPFLNAALIRYMIKNKGNYDIVIPRIDRKFHPLLGLYNKNCIPAIEERLKHGYLNVSGIFSKLKTHFVSVKEIRRIDSGLLSLVNINTKKDLILARELQRR